MGLQIDGTAYPLELLPCVLQIPLTIKRAEHCQFGHYWPHAHSSPGVWKRCFASYFLQQIKTIFVAEAEAETKADEKAEATEEAEAVEATEAAEAAEAIKVALKLTAS